jgi:hypothetical protein
VRTDSGFKCTAGCPACGPLIKLKFRRKRLTADWTVCATFLLLLRSALSFESVSFSIGNPLAHYDPHFVWQTIVAQENRILRLTYSIEFNAGYAPTKGMRILNLNMIGRRPRR